MIDGDRMTKRDNDISRLVILDAKQEKVGKMKECRETLSPAEVRWILFVVCGPIHSFIYSFIHLFVRCLLYPFIIVTISLFRFLIHYFTLSFIYKEMY